MTIRPQAVTVRVGKPYAVISGGRSGMHQERGQRRDYTASVLGSDIRNTSKDEIQRIIRAKFYRATGSNRVDFTFEEQA